MHAGRVAYCHLVSHGEYATGQTDGQTDGCQTITLYFPLDAARVMMELQSTAFE